MALFNAAAPDGGRKTSMAVDRRQRADPRMTATLIENHFDFKSLLNTLWLSNMKVFENDLVYK